MNGFIGEEIINVTKRKEEWIIFFIEKYSLIDGEHHKIWLIDQISRIAMGTEVIAKLAIWENGNEELRCETGSPSEKYLDWIAGSIDDEDYVGIAP